MDELAPNPHKPKRDPVKREAAALRGLCASLNAGFTAPGGAPASVQEEIKQAMKQDPTPADPPAVPAFKQEVPPARKDMPALETETLPETPLPTQEARAETLVHREEEDTPITGAASDEPVSLEVPLESELPDPEPHPSDADSPATDMSINPKYRKVLFTGQMKAGKDHCAEAASYQVLSLAAPLYALLDFFFGVDEKTKDAPGARVFMQRVGTWGRGEIDESIPVSPERAVFLRMIQAHAAAGILPMSDTVDWGSFGRNKNIWLDACMKRADKILAEDGSAMVAVVNGRFKNEIEALDAAGWSRWHVMASELALRQRREKDGVPAASLQHSSEQLARALDKSSIAVAQKTQKPKINVIWNDPAAGRPTSKFYTLREFVSTVHSIPTGG